VMSAHLKRMKKAAVEVRSDDILGVVDLTTSTH
jgi:hypothetical protein